MFPSARTSSRTWRSPTVTSLTLALALTVSGCGLLVGDASGQPSDDITVTSPVIGEGAPLPARYTCDGAGVSPPLRWSGLPEATESIAVVVDDPTGPSGAVVHWTVFGLDPADPELPEGTVPQPARQGSITADSAEYDPPCPSGEREHEYRFTVYALGQELELSEGAALDEVLDAIAAHTLARGRLLATGGADEE